MKGRDITVVVAEDDPSILEITAALLDDLGFETLPALNAYQALGHVMRNDVDVVFCDVDMPGDTDGIKLAASLRHQVPEIQVVLTSGWMWPGKGNVPKGCLFFRKPYDVEEVAKSFVKRGLSA